MGRSVLIVDDSSVVRRILNQLFTGNGEFHVCGEAENGEKLLKGRNSCVLISL